MSVHSSASCSNSNAAGRPANWLGEMAAGWTDPERDGTFNYCGSTGWFYNPANNTWLFSVGYSALCPNPAGSQNFFTFAYGQAWEPATGSYKSMLTVQSPILTA